jgi:predicted PurR-regulated permease PerM
MVRHRAIADKMHHVVAGYVTGQLTVSALGATFAGLAVFTISFFFPAVPANLAIPVAAITFTLSLIPMFGATIAGVLACLLLGFNAVGAAIAYAVYFLIYQQIENNFVSPTIQSKRLELSPLAVLSAVTIGLYLFGVVGGIISIPIAGCIKVLLEDYLEHARDERKKEERPLHKLVKKVKDA